MNAILKEPRLIQLKTNGPIYHVAVDWCVDVRVTQTIHTRVASRERTIFRTVKRNGPVWQKVTAALAARIARETEAAR